MPHYQKHIFFCVNQKQSDKKCCAGGGGQQLFDFAKQRVHELALNQPGGVRVSCSGCLGRCSLGPSVVIYPEAVWYHPTSEQDVEQIIQQHLLGGEIVTDLLMDN